MTDRTEPASSRTTRTGFLKAAAVAGGHLIALGLYPKWSGGSAYGARYATDVVPWLFLHAKDHKPRGSDLDAAIRRELIQLAMQSRRLPVIGQLLRFREVFEGDEGIVQLPIANFSAVQLPRYPVVAIAVKLQTERAPRRHSHIAQA